MTLSRTPAARRIVRRTLLSALAGLIVVPLLGQPGRADPASAARIVSLGGAVTEILYDLGAEGQVVAVDTTSVFPSSVLATKPNVGYLRQLSAEGILSVAPTLVLAIDGAGPPDILKIVREAGVALETVPDEPTEAGVIHRIEAVARAIGRESAGLILSDDVRRRFASVAVARARLGRKVRALFILSLQNGRTMVGGRDTTADGILALAGAENAAASITGYKPITDEAILAAQPDAIVMMTVGPGGGPPADLFDGPAFSKTPAARGRTLVTMNGLYLLGFGPRTPEAARDLMAALYPGEKLE